MLKGPGAIWSRRQLLVAAAGLMSACGATGARAGLASLSPAVTETVAHLGALSQLVARSTWCTSPAEVARLPAAGTALTPDFEALVRLAPALILVEAAGALPRSELERIGTVEVLPWLQLAEVQASVRRIGELVERRDQAGRVAAALAALAEPARATDPTTLALLGSDPRAAEQWYVRSDSLHGAALASAGWRPALPEPPPGPPVLSLEALIRLDPEVLILLEAADWGEERVAERLAAWAPWTALRAVRERRLHVLAAPSLMSTGPAILETQAMLRKLRGR